MEPSKKQYLLMVDELGAALLGKLMPSLQLVEIRAMPLNDNKDYQLLVNPIVKPDCSAEVKPEVISDAQCPRSC